MIPVECHGDLLVYGLSIDAGQVYHASAKLLWKCAADESVVKVQDAGNDRETDSMLMSPIAEGFQQWMFVVSEISGLEKNRECK